MQKRLKSANDEEIKFVTLYSISYPSLITNYF